MAVELIYVGGTWHLALGMSCSRNLPAARLRAHSSVSSGGLVMLFLRVLPRVHPHGFHAHFGFSYTVSDGGDIPDRCGGATASDYGHGGPQCHRALAWLHDVAHLRCG